MEKVSSVLVIGAGPSGLVVLKTLLENGFCNVTCVEASSFVGGTFRNKSYDDGRLVSSKFITAFSDFRMGEDMDDHPSIEEYCKYLEQYCDHFHLWSAIEFNTSVQLIEKETNQYNVTLKDKNGTEQKRVYDAVAVCSGLHNDPWIPNDIHGLSTFPGKMFHSIDYKSKEVFTNQRTLIIGSGETGLDLVYRAIQKSDNVVLNTRSGFLSVPYVIGKHVPLDTFITNLFECSHQSWLVSHYQLKWKFTTPFIRLAFLLGTGHALGYNQWAGCKSSSLVKRGHLIINKSTDAMPFINRPFKKKSWFGRNIYSQLDHTEIYPDREVSVKMGQIKNVNGKVVTFADGSTGVFDIIVFATGYRITFPFLPKVKTVNGQAVLPDMHNIINPQEPRLAYFGFIRPNVGAIPPMSEMQVMWWIQHIRGLVKTRVPPSYWLVHRCTRTGLYGCDYGAYMHDLAREVGSAPSILHLLRVSPKSLIAWALGQAYVTFFRIAGPFSHAKAIQTSSTELYDIIWKRPVVSNLLFLSIIGIFGAVNAAGFVVSPFVAPFVKK